VARKDIGLESAGVVVAAVVGVVVVAAVAVAAAVVVVGGADGAAEVAEAAKMRSPRPRRSWTVRWMTTS